MQYDWMLRSMNFTAYDRCLTSQKNLLHINLILWIALEIDRVLEIWLSVTSKYIMSGGLILYSPQCDNNKQAIGNNYQCIIFATYAITLRKVCLSPQVVLLQVFSSVISVLPLLCCNMCIFSAKIKSQRVIVSDTWKCLLNVMVA